MKKSLKILFSVFWVLTGFVNAGAQPVWMRFVSSLTGKCLEFPYTCAFSGSKGSYTMSGDVKLQGDSYVISAANYNIYCDGHSLWEQDLFQSGRQSLSECWSVQSAVLQFHC